MITLEQETRIRDIKQELSDTDYHVLKMNELHELGLSVPETYKDIIRHRMELRRELNEIEESIK